MCHQHCACATLEVCVAREGFAVCVTHTFDIEHDYLWRCLNTEHDCVEMMLQVERILGNLMTHSICTPCQIKCLIVSAAIKDSWSGLICMDLDDLPWHQGLAVKAG